MHRCERVEAVDRTAMALLTDAPSPVLPIGPGCSSEEAAA
jgi:hypothetical protein